MTAPAGGPGPGGTRAEAGPRRGRGWTTVGLVAALAAAAALLGLPTETPQRPAAPGLVTLAGTWPDAKPTEIPGVLPDGPGYAPLFFLDAHASLGTAPSADGRQLRLVLRAADGQVRELRRLPAAASPQYVGFVLAGDDVAWAESVADGAGLGRTEIWAADLRTGAPPRRVTADTGDVVFFNSQYDIVAADGRLHWMSVPRDTQGETEIRSVALSGGPVTARTEPGQWALSAWPWLVSAGSGQTGPVQLRDVDGEQVVRVKAAPTELLTCSPVWCRVLVLSGEDGPARLDLMRPDGSERQRVAGGTATASVMDVALLDRFEVLSLVNSQTAVTSKQQLVLYDIQRKRTVVVADGVGSVLTRAGLLWWSTGDNETTSWHALDLRTLD
ncbi:hypothetical protein SAMN05444365_101552 [Micromonospora pattaloongensis]|uniref:WD40-like Beta Propeller Repeat n=1 Tax=Micromonospora pattaloongensis TaxID=405436 RepID=A0A1H3GT79_9ACTN|nr:hypothetical protein [Micromonospora pattaloongensis]SDY06481.1 hypothetical protein SAMN05444365_101552 [Micromonospora pattaloongensis]